MSSIFNIRNGHRPTDLSDGHGPNLQAQIHYLLDIVAMGIMVLGIPSGLIAAARMREFGWQPGTGVQWLAVVIMVAAFFGRRHTRYEVRAGIYLVGIFVYGAAGLATWGLSGQGLLFMLACSVLAAVVWNLQVGLVVTGIAVLTASIFGLAFCNGWLHLAFDPGNYAVAASSWLTAVVTLGLLMVVCAFLLGRVKSTLLAHMQALQRSEERLREVFDRSRDTIYKFDTHTGECNYINPAALANTGFSAEEWRHRGLELFWFQVHPGDRERIRRHLQDIVTLADAIDREHWVEYRFKRKGGAYEWYSDCHVVVGSPEGEARYIIGNTRNINESKRAESFLRESEIKFRRLFESCPDGIVTMDFNGRLLSANRSFLQMTGRQRDDLTAASLPAITSGKSLPTLQSTLDHFRSGVDSGVPIEIGLKSQDDTRLTADVRFWTIRDRESRPVALGAFIKDISREKRLAREKKQLEQRLLQARKLEAIGTLAGGIAHDFNNIMAGIIGYAELALKHHQDSEYPIERHLNRILDAGQRARDLVRRILTFSRKDHTAFEPLNLMPIITETLELLQATLPKSITVHTRLGDENLPVRGDAGQLHQVVMNLCTNAYQAMRVAGGALKVEAARTHLDKDCTFPNGRLSAGEYIRISVKDTGRGIDPEHISRIFDPYFTTRQKENGTGLGLATVIGIVDRHGGTMDVSSVAGTGTCFYIYLPFFEEDHPSIKPVDTATPIRGGTERILLVDDEANFVDAVRLHLEDLGYGVVATCRPAEALDRFAADPAAFDLVISDQNMPGLNGHQLLGKLSRIRPETPVILCTGFSEIVNESNAASLGAAALMVKPVTCSELATTVRRVLDDRTGPIGGKPAPGPHSVPVADIRNASPAPDRPSSSKPS